jgi:hypothetical protein
MIMLKLFSHTFFSSATHLKLSVSRSEELLVVRIDCNENKNVRKLIKEIKWEII